jgi:hypothetical protein
MLTHSRARLCVSICFPEDEYGQRMWAWRKERCSENWAHGEEEQSRRIFLFDLQDVSVLKSSLNPRALISVVYFNGWGKKERRARVEQISFYICQSESLGP